MKEKIERIYRYFGKGKKYMLSIINKKVRGKEFVCPSNPDRVFIKKNIKDKYDITSSLKYEEWEE